MCNYKKIILSIFPRRFQINYEWIENPFTLDVSKDSKNVYRQKINLLNILVIRKLNKYLVKLLWKYLDTFIHE